MLRYMACGADYKTTGDAEGKMSKTSVFRSMWEAVDFVYYNHERYIRWPQTEEELAQKARLYDVNRYAYKPYCVGSVDCTQVGIQTPNYHWQEEAFVNRNSYHSINTMVSALRSKHILSRSYF